MTENLPPIQAESMHIQNICNPEEPGVYMSWGNQSGKLTADEAIAHAMGLLEAAFMARVEASIVTLFTQKLDLPSEESLKLIAYIGSVRDNSPSPSVTMWMDGEPVTPDEGRKCALDLLMSSFTSESEYWLVRVLKEHMSVDDDAINSIIKDLRSIRNDVSYGVLPPQELMERKRRPRGFGS